MFEDNLRDKKIIEGETQQPGKILLLLGENQIQDLNEKKANILERKKRIEKFILFFL
jgi:hypothetical protein